MMEREKVKLSIEEFETIMEEVYEEDYDSIYDYKRALRVRLGIEQ